MNYIEGVILMQKKAVAFTGHRPESLPFGRDMHSGRYDDFELILWKEIGRCIDEGYDTFYCGGARGADIVCGEVQPLGIHMQYGGGCAGFIAMQNDEKLVSSLPTYLYGLLTTQNEGEYGWGRALNYRCSHGSRENANEYFGTESGLWAIVAGVYLASMPARSSPLRMTRSSCPSPM